MKRLIDLDSQTATPDGSSRHDLGAPRCTLVYDMTGQVLMFKIAPHNSG